MKTCWGLFVMDPFKVTQQVGRGVRTRSSGFPKDWIPRLVLSPVKCSNCEMPGTLAKGMVVAVGNPV